MSSARKIARAFKTLSVDTRVRIVELLRDGPLCVNALAARVGVTPAAVSQHLRVLRDADLVTADKRGYYVHYSINQATLQRWRRLADTLLGAEAEGPRRHRDTPKLPRAHPPAKE